jgi:superoxide dismutase, Cu-Zn family
MPLGRGWLPVEAGVLYRRSGCAVGPIVFGRPVGDRVFDADGGSFVVRADGDDVITDPSGNSGARIACGVISVG